MTGILSGDGFYAGSGNRAGPVPYVFVTAGTLIELQGYGLTTSAAAPRAMFIGDIPIPVFQNQRFQIPWDLAPGDYPLRVESNSPFEQPASLSVRETSPAFLFAPSYIGNNLLFHAEDMKPVTDQNPAVSGEIVVGYMVGLGGTTPRVETGKPTPNILATVAPGFECLLDGA